ncbi:hypothetical protein ACTSKR_12815 [Chitinibacteraceae bacterium HSL-7]
MLNKRTIIKFAVLVVASTVSVGTRAADKGCLIEGDIVIGGKTKPTKDCLENSGVPDDQFKSVCQSLSQASEHLAKALGSPPPKTTYLPSCPAKATASCLGFFGQAMTSYYYKRDAKDLAETKESCVAQGGKWKQ